MHNIDDYFNQKSVLCVSLDFMKYKLYIVIILDGKWTSHFNDFGTLIHPNPACCSFFVNGTLREVGRCCERWSHLVISAWVWKIAKDKRGERRYQNKNEKSPNVACIMVSNNDCSSLASRFELWKTLDQESKTWNNGDQTL